MGRTPKDWATLHIFIWLIIRILLPYYNKVKTTIDLDEQKLKRVMQLTGIKTRREAIDFALTEAERIAAIDSYYQKTFYADDTGLVVDPDYDVLARRNEDPSRLS